MAALPSFGQHSEVVVKRTEAVQVSTGDESPNLSQVNSVSIYYINCYNVVYCGPPSTDSVSGGTYTFTSGSTPLWATSQALNSAVFTPESITSPASSTGLPSIANGVLTTSLDPLSTSVPALPGATDVGRMLSNMAGQPLSMGDQASVSWSGAALENNLTISTANQSSLAVSNYVGPVNLASAFVSGSNPLPLNEPSWMTKSSTLDSTISLATITDGSLPRLMSDGNIDVGHLLLTASSSTAPILTNVPTLLGTTPLNGTAFPAGLAAGVSGSLIGGLSAASGTSSESLSQQLENIKESGAKIVSWSMLYDTSPVQNN
jgi:hypothetical protein